MNRFENFTFLINKIHRDIQRIKLEELKKHGLKGSHMTCIHYLGKSDRGLSFKEVCKICDEDKSLVSKNLNYLVNNGLVVKDVIEDRTYKGKFKLSEMGRELFKKIDEKTNSVCSQIYLDKDEEELKVFYSNLKEISEKLSFHNNKNYNR